MFFFNKSSNSPYIDFSDISVDMHSHLIPGIDDGSRDVNESITLIKGLNELGFSHLFTTPHSFMELYPNTRQTLLQGYEAFKEYIPEETTLKLSSEYYHDEQFNNDLEADALLPLPGNRLLIEFSQISLPLDLERLVSKIIARGYQPIIAHPERYTFFYDRMELLLGLKALGVELQVNALSLTPYYGKNVRVFAEHLIDLKLIDFIGTDIHRITQLETLSEVPASAHYAKLLDSGLLKNQSLLSY